ncbi:methyltransferase domain-containing protein [Deinococcus sp. SDU3-2]|uniref:Methyltransferase domain-containing protein n=1 Tax=Deinococcus terrestris TaxID=2651870 RepID=A0A7X1NV92_9DEIO|nr:methyltransferase domain-containing protein [Deinococcus terrestris]MPY66044.1 methyltransferase domain-containing protein [Deinococcus terrestris]
MPRPARVNPSRQKNPTFTRPQKPKGDHRARQPAHEYALEALPGLEEVAAEELRGVPLARDLRGLRFWYPGDPERLTRLRGAVAAYRVRAWDVPRPRGLLGHQQLGELTAFLGEVVRWGGHRSFRLAAAGRESAVMIRLAEELSRGLDLPFDPEEGELLVRLRPQEGGPGWEVLARITPRPLSARAWRVCNRGGGLNATIAYALHRLAGVREEDRVFNPMAGSGTLLVERALLGPSAAMVGVDIDPGAVACARANLQAAGREVEVAEVDALATGLPPRSFDLIVCDLPWGDAIGSHRANAALYPAFLTEMHRLLSRHGRLAVVTHEIRLFEGLLRDQDRWHVRELFQVYSGGHHPKGYLLSKR